MCVHRTMPKGLLGKSTYTAVNTNLSRPNSEILKELNTSKLRCLADEEPTFLQAAVGLARRGLFKLGQIAQNIRI